MVTRKNNCPKCGYKLLARKDDHIICLAPACNWEIESKRGEDINLPEFNELREAFND